MKLFFNILFLIKKLKSQSYPCHFVKFDEKNKTVFFQIKMKPIILKYTLEEAVFSSSLVSVLSPTDACLLGGYYGRQFKSLLSSKKIKGGIPRLENKIGDFQMISLERNGNIKYIDKKNKKIHCQFPINIVKNEYLISKFDPTQACYIGILAGKNAEKLVSNKKNIIKNINRTPVLHLIK